MDGQLGFRDCFNLNTNMRKNSKANVESRPGRVLLVDRHAFMRQAAAAWINLSPGLEVCGMAGDMPHAYMAVRQLRPDVVVAEIMRPRDLGFIRELHRQHPRLPILVFSMREEALHGARARAAGANGYLMKEAGGNELVRRIHAVLEGRIKSESDGPGAEAVQPAA